MWVSRTSRIVLKLFFQQLNLYSKWSDVPICPWHFLKHPILPHNIHLQRFSNGLTQSHFLAVPVPLFSTEMKNNPTRLAVPSNFSPMTANVEVCGNGVVFEILPTMLIFLNYFWISGKWWQSIPEWGQDGDILRRCTVAQSQFLAAPQPKSGREGT